jgi:hypothetical protein
MFKPEAAVKIKRQSSQKYKDIENWNEYQQLPKKAASIAFSPRSQSFR